MQTYLTTLLLVTSSISLLIAQENGSIHVKINDIKTGHTGLIILMLFSTNDGFPSEVTKAYKTGIITEYDTCAQFMFRNIPTGDYSVALFLDENGDGTMDCNFIGLPKEPVGASKQTGLGKPTFSRSVFQHNLEATQVQMPLLNQ